LSGNGFGLWLPNLAGYIGLSHSGATHTPKMAAWLSGLFGLSQAGGNTKAPAKHIQIEY